MPLKNDNHSPEANSPQEKIELIPNSNPLRSLSELTDLILSDLASYLPFNKLVIFTQLNRKFWDMRSQFWAGREHSFPLPENEEKQQAPNPKELKINCSYEKVKLRFSDLINNWDEINEKERSLVKHWLLLDSEKVDILLENHQENKEIINSYLESSIDWNDEDKNAFFYFCYFGALPHATLLIRIILFLNNNIPTNSMDGNYLRKFLTKNISALGAAVANNHQSTIQILLDLLDLDNEFKQDFFTNNAYVLIYLACLNGHIHIVEHLWRLLKNNDDICTNLIKEFVFNDYVEICTNGYFEIFRFLWNEVLVQCNHRLGFLRCWDYRLFHSACENDHVNLAQFLWDSSDDTLRYEYLNSIGAFAATNGHDKVLNLLLRFAKTDSRLLAELKTVIGPILFVSACANGHHQVITFLCSFTDKNNELAIFYLSYNNYEAFRLSAANGHTQVARMLFELADIHLGMHEKMLVANNYEGFRAAAENDHVEIIAYQWQMAAVYEGMQDGMIRENNYSAFIVPLATGKSKVFKLFVSLLKESEILHKILLYICNDVMLLEKILSAYRYTHTDELLVFWDLCEPYEYLHFKLIHRYQHKIFYLTIECDYFDLLKKLCRFVEYQSDRKEILTENNYSLFNTAIISGFSNKTTNIVKLLWNFAKFDKDLQYNMLTSFSNFYIYIFVYDYINLVSLLWDYSSPYPDIRKRLFNDICATRPNYIALKPHAWIEEASHILKTYTQSRFNSAINFFRPNITINAIRKIVATIENNLHDEKDVFYVTSYLKQSLRDLKLKLGSDANELNAILDKIQRLPVPNPAAPIQYSPKR